MKTPYRERNFLRILQEICKEEQIQIEYLSENWLIRLSKSGRHRFIIGYNFEVNAATAQMIAQDKCATYEVLRSSGVPAVEHQLFIGPQTLLSYGGTGNWSLMQQYAAKHQYRIVCKPVKGSGGKDVYFVKTSLELEAAVQDLFSRHRSIALSPFEKISDEYRVILFDGEAQITYAKKIPILLGNGKDTVQTLIHKQFVPEQGQRILENLGTEIDLNYTPKEKEQVSLQQKHNLGVMAQPALIQAPQLLTELHALARVASQALNIRFASVDIVQVAGELKVLEINSGVMGEHFSRSSQEAYQLTLNTYKKVIQALFR